MGFEDAELDAMSNISAILNTLDPDTRARVLRWVGDKFYKNDVNFKYTNEHSAANNSQILEIEDDSSELVEFHNIADFIEYTIGNGFDSLQLNDQILVTAYFLENNKNQTVFSNKDILEELKPLGIIPSNMTVYTKRLTEKRFVYSVDGGNSLTKKGRDHVLGLLENVPTSSPQKPRNSNANDSEHDHKTQTSNAKPKKKSKRKPDNIKVNKELLKELDAIEPSFKKFLSNYDTEKHSSHSVYISLCVLYLTEHMEKVSVSIEDIATCFKIGQRTPPDFFRQAVTDTANKQGYLLYSGQDDIQILSAGRNFLNSIKQ